MSFLFNFYKSWSFCVVFRRVRSMLLDFDHLFGIGCFWTVLINFCLELVEFNPF